MADRNTNLFQRFDITFFSKHYLKKNVLDKYYQNSLRENKKKTRSDAKISCSNMVLFLLLWVLHPEESYQSVLNKVMGFLFKESKNTSKTLASITAAGLCKARKRFSSKILKRFWQFQIVTKYYKDKGEKLWKGFKVCAVDGTSFTLTKSKEILKQFPLQKNAKLPKILGSVLYDVYSKIPLNIVFSPFPGNERAQLINLIKEAKTMNMLLLMDRGYPAYWVLFKLFDLKTNFVIRIPSYFSYTKVKKLGKNDFIVNVFLTKSTRYTCKKSLSIADFIRLPKVITVRLIKTQMKGFRPRWIITSLTNVQKYSYKEICKLYCDRWIIENYYRDLKHILKVEKFHSKYVDGIYQEIYAAMILTIILQKHIIKAYIPQVQRG